MSSSPAIAAHAGTYIYRGLLRRVFSFPVMLCSMLVVLVTFTVRSRFDDPDMWWHLKTGEVIWTTHAIPTTDLFSYTAIHHAWVPQEWLSQVTIYGAYRWTGYSGLMVWLCVATSMLLILSYFLCSSYSGNSKTSLVGSLTVWFFATSGLAVRPQMIGYLCLVTELLLVHLGLTHDRRWLYLLPLLFAVWVNCHASFFFGLLVLGVFLLCSFFDFRKGFLVALHRGPALRWTLALALVLSIGSSFLSPDGAHQFLYPLNAMLHLPLNLSMVEEWKPLQLTTGRGIGLVIVLGCIFLMLIVRRCELYWHELLLLVIATVLATDHQRMLFVFGILAAPVLSRLIAPLWDNYDPVQDKPIANAVLIMLSVALTFIAFPSRANMERQVDKRSPVKAVEFIKTHHLSGNMLNAYAYGGYLIWAAPEYPTFVDGRGDLFEWAGVLNSFAKWTLLEEDPNNLLNKWNVHFCLLEQGSPIVQVMRLLPGWKLAYSDDISVIFVRDTFTHTSQPGHRR